MSKRIESAMSAAKITQTALAESMGVTPQAVQQWVSGHTAPKGKRLEKLAMILGVKIDWLLTGAQTATLDDISGSFQGNIIQPVNANASLDGGFDSWDDKTPLHDDEVALNFFREIELSAGAGRYEVIENHGRKLRFSKSTLRRLNINVEQAACVTISGNSMEPVLPDGCKVGIDTSKTEIKNGALYAIDHDGHLRVKMIYRMPGDTIRLRSYNSEEWPDELYSGENATKIRIIGRVFWYSAFL